MREVNGNKVLVKTTEGSSLLSRARAYFGPSDFSNYTVEADINAPPKSDGNRVTRASLRNAMC